MARERPDTVNLALCLVFAAEVHRRRREVRETGEYAKAAIAVACEQGFPIYLAWGTVLQGWEMAERGNPAEGIARIHQGLTAYAATGASLGRPNLLAMLAEACGKAGKPEAGVDYLAEGLDFAHDTGEIIDGAALHRLKGELILQISPQREDEALACFQKATEVARHQGARSLELQATLALARLWRHQGKPDSAREILLPIHRTFTEGFDLSDWNEAKVELELLIA